MAWIRSRPEWELFRALGHAHRAMAWMWWTALLMRGVLPAALAVAMGSLVAAVERGQPTGAELTAFAVVFGLLQVLPPLHRALSANLGNRTADWLYDKLAVACVRPPGIGHLEDPRFATDLSMARDFDMGMTGPPLSFAMDFIAAGLVEMVAGLAASLVLFGYSWWAPPLLAGAWFSTQWLLRESGVWKDRNTDQVRQAQRHADYAYRVAVDPPAAKELRLFGIADWIVERFATNRRRLQELQWHATRLRERSVALSLALTLAANLLVLVAIARDAASGAIGLGPAITYIAAANATALIAFGGLSWALDGAAAPVSAVARLGSAMPTAGSVRTGARNATGLPAVEIRFRDVSFAYAPGAPPVLDGFNLSIPAGSSLAIVGVNGAGKTTLAKLLCRLYDPQSGAIEADRTDVREIDIHQWRSRLAAVFQDFIRFELPLRDNVAPGGGGAADVEAAIRDAGAEQVAALDTVLAKGYSGGTDLSGGQWQRVALARALCAVRLGAGVVILDEPTAQLDVRGEAEIFDRILEATRHTTTILISHRFSTVRHADRICVLEQGKVVELGSHEELMAAAGRYKTMFDLQASRFEEDAHA